MPKIDFSNADKALKIPSLFEEYYEYGKSWSDYRHLLAKTPTAAGYFAKVTIAMEDDANGYANYQTSRQKLMDYRLYENMKNQVKKYLDIVNDPVNQFLESGKETAQKCAENYYNRVEPMKNLNQLARIATAPRATNRIANEQYDQREALNRDVADFNAKHPSPFYADFSTRAEFDNFQQKLTGNTNKTPMNDIAKDFTYNQMRLENNQGSNVLQTVEDIKIEYEKNKAEYLQGQISPEKFEKLKGKTLTRLETGEAYLETNQDRWESYAGKNIALKNLPDEGLKRIRSIRREINAPPGPGQEENNGIANKSVTPNASEQLASLEKRLGRLDSAVAEIKSDVKKIISFVNAQSTQGVTL